MKKEQILNDVIAKNGYKSFLELTLGTSICEHIQCEVKHSVTDITNIRRKYDIIFIDGDHTHQQCEKDIIWAIPALNEEGLIALHDINPEQIEQQEVPRKVRLWTGDVWRCY